MRTVTRRILLNHTDAFGIAFTGQLVTIAMEAVEEVLAGTAMDYAQLLRERRFGTPVVHLESDFRRPLRHGQTAEIRVSCQRIGERSYSMRAEFVTSEDGPAATITMVHACVDHTLAPCALPEAIRTTLAELGT